MNFLSQAWQSNISCTLQSDRESVEDDELSAQRMKSRRRVSSVTRRADGEKKKAIKAVKSSNPSRRRSSNCSFRGAAATMAYANATDLFS